MIHLPDPGESHQVGDWAVRESEIVGVAGQLPQARASGRRLRGDVGLVGEQETVAGQGFDRGFGFFEKAFLSC